MRKLTTGMAVLFLWLGAATAGAVQQEAAPGSAVLIEKHDGTRIEIAAELAVSPQERAQGLMFRESLADDAGMLFIFDKPRRASMWMRNTLIPLDMVFIRENGRIANIIHRAEPHTETQRLSKGRVRAVLELRGGRAEELGLGAGDIVRHPLLGNFFE